LRLEQARCCDSAENEPGDIHQHDRAVLAMRGSDAFDSVA
jgi:hypothetical protein